MSVAQPTTSTTRQHGRGRPWIAAAVVVAPALAVYFIWPLLVLPSEEAVVKTYLTALLTSDSSNFTETDPQSLADEVTQTYGEFLTSKGLDEAISARDAAMVPNLARMNDFTFAVQSVRLETLEELQCLYKASVRVTDNKTSQQTTSEVAGVAYVKQDNGVSKIDYMTIERSLTGFAFLKHSDTVSGFSAKKRCAHGRISFSQSCFNGASRRFGFSY